MHRELEPPIHEITLQPDKSKSLHQQVIESIAAGYRRIFLEGHFSEIHTDQFSMITFYTQETVELIGIKNAIIDGCNRTAHLLFLEDHSRVKVSGITFTGGNTEDLQLISSLHHHPQKRLNVFRYLDGAAVTIGTGCELLIENCTFLNNHSAICGGAISNLGGYLHIRGCTFRDNSCGDTGAAIDNLASGSLTIIEQTHFINNTANQLGGGNAGAVTAFPDTYLIVQSSDFSGEQGTAIDYRANRKGLGYVKVDKHSIFNDMSTHPIIKNPNSNRGVQREILKRYSYLLTRHPGYITLGGIPTVSSEIRKKHSELFSTA